MVYSLFWKLTHSMKKGTRYISFYGSGNNLQYFKFSHIIISVSMILIFSTGFLQSSCRFVAFFCTVSIWMDVVRGDFTVHLANKSIWQRPKKKLENIQLHWLGWVFSKSRSKLFQWRGSIKTRFNIGHGIIVSANCHPTIIDSISQF